MGELGQGVGLSMKILNGLSPLFGVREPIKNFLDSDLSLSQPLILSDIDDTHPARRPENAQSDTDPPGPFQVRVDRFHFATSTMPRYS